MIDAQREVVLLPAVDLAAACVLGLLDRNASRGDGHDHCTSRDANEAQHQNGESSDTNLARLGGLAWVKVLNNPADSVRHAAEDARGQNDGDAVTNAVLVDLLAEPHEEQTAGGQCGDTHHKEDGDLRCTLQEHRLHQVGAAQVIEPDIALNNAETHGDVPGPLHDLLLARLPFLLQFLQGRVDRLQQLEDDRSSDVGHDAQAKDGALTERAAREDACKLQQATKASGVGCRSLGIFNQG